MLKIAFDKIYKHPLDENHRFPMIKYDLIPEQLLRENTCNHENFFIPSSLKDNNVLVLNFDKYGVLTNKNLLNKGDLNNIDFSKQTTKNVFSEKSFVQSFLESIKQKMYGNRK